MDDYGNPVGEGQYFSNINTRLRDLEEKQKLLKDRTLLIGQNLVDGRESTFNELQESKKELLRLKKETLKMIEFVQRLSEQVSGLARKEELMILQRQIDILKPHIKTE